MTEIDILSPGGIPGGQQPAIAGQRAFGSSDHLLTPILIKYWQLMLRWRWLIVAIMATCVAIAVISVMLSPSLFTAQSQIEISREKKNITDVKGLENPEEFGGDEFYDTQYQLLKAGSLAERVARDMKLADQPGFFAAHGIVLGADKTPLTAAGRKERESWAAGLLMGGIRINPIRNSSLVDIGYTSQSPQWSARIANAWPQGYIAANLDRGLASTSDARTFLEKRLDELRSKLALSESDLINFARERNIVTLAASRDDKGRTEQPQTLVARNLSDINSALNTARTDRIAAESRAHAQAGEFSPEVIQSGTIASLRAKRMEIAAEYDRLLVQFEPGYPGARALKQQMDSLDVAISREVGRIRGGRVATYNEALRRENELAAQVDSLKSKFDQQQRDTIQYNVLQREVDTNRQLYDSLLQRYKEIGLSGSVGATNIVIVDPAQVPGGPSAPSLSNHLFMALLTGLILANLAIFALEQIDSGVRSPDDIERLFKLPLLGNTPKCEGDILAQLDDPKSAFSESCQSIRAVLAFATSHGLPQTLLVTSAQPGEGKSTTTLAIAMAVSRSGKRVLLIDADMRSPSAHKLLGCSNEKGFSNLLTGDGFSSQTILDTRVTGLSVLPAGPKPPSTAELLSIDRLSVLFETLRQQFDHIIIDAPPIQGMADSPILGAAVEGTAFIIEAEKTTVRAIRHSLERLRLVNAHVVGAIVTKVDYKKHSLGYGYSYGYGYGYGYGSSDDEKA